MNDYLSISKQICIFSIFAICIFKKLIVCFKAFFNVIVVGGHLKTVWTFKEFTMTPLLDQNIKNMWFLNDLFFIKMLKKYVHMKHEN